MCQPQGQGLGIQSWVIRGRTFLKRFAVSWEADAETRGGSLRGRLCEFPEWLKRRPEKRRLETTGLCCLPALGARGQTARCGPAWFLRGCDRPRVVAAIRGVPWLVDTSPGVCLTDTRPPFPASLSPGRMLSLDLGPALTQDDLVTSAKTLVQTKSYSEVLDGETFLGRGLKFHPLQPWDKQG